MRQFTLLFFALFTLSLSAAEGGDNSQEVYDRVYAQLSYCGNCESSPANDLVLTAQELLATPYVAGLLEGEREELIVDLTQTDCILFVESCLAAVADAQMEFPSYDNFKDNVRRLRYRNGRVDGYASRIHYTSEWIAQGERMGCFEEVTARLSGEKFNQEFSFMSENYTLYPKLKESPQLRAEIEKIEERLNSAQEYYMIPSQRVAQVLSQIEDGDIVAFVTSVKGLDISHIGIINRLGERVTFIHASSLAGEVVIHPTDLVDYINSSSKIRGIRLIRLR
ncbi:MAG: N-acetylmuramoyl-L-alanine amidase-like domain-containing protein [Rikenellaceae bacterium]